MIDGMLVIKWCLSLSRWHCRSSDLVSRWVLYRMLHVNVGAARSGPDWPGPKEMSNHPSKLISATDVFIAPWNGMIDRLLGIKRLLSLSRWLCKINKSRFKASFCTILGNDLANLVDVIYRSRFMFVLGVAWQWRSGPKRPEVARSGPKWPGVTRYDSGQSPKGSNRLSEINSIFFLYYIILYVL